MTSMPTIISLSNPKSPEAEAYRTLRTNLQFSTVDHELQTLLVTSSNASEGKTTTICNLAVSFAQIGKKVLIIDGDLRRPRLHTYLNVSNVKGLSNVLTHQATLEEAMKETVLDIQVLTCGPIPPNPSELLNSNRLKQLLVELKSQFDIILIDTPPVGVVTDAAILSTLVDGTLIVVASHQTESDQAVRAMKLLNNVGARILGSVLTKVPADRKGYYGYQYYEYTQEHESKKRTRRLKKAKAR
ncbi:Tyrosine-protein kinase YwqD [Turicibacter sanguinis]|nr:Tyrosine-protein kinase YwqD [Turicibacter sanguinis]